MNEFARPNLAVDQLPPANSADKDKVLTIDANGVPVWAENSGGGSGGGVLMIEDDEALGSFNKTFREVKTAFLAGSTVIWCASTINGIYYLMDGLDVSNLTVNFGGGNILMADSEDGYLFSPD